MRAMGNPVPMVRHQANRWKDTTKCCNGESCLEECMRVGFGSISPTGWRREEGERSRARMKVVVGLATPNSKKILLQVPSPSHSRKQVRLAGATHPPLCRTCISPTALRLSVHPSIRVFPVPPSRREKESFPFHLSRALEGKKTTLG